jgi:hypothetical protein
VDELWKGKSDRIDEPEGCCVGQADVENGHDDSRNMIGTSGEELVEVEIWSSTFCTHSFDSSGEKRKRATGCFGATLATIRLGGETLNTLPLRRFSGTIGKATPNLC